MIAPKFENVVIRVGEKNNFNHTNEEFEALKKFHTKGHIFTNSNSFVKIDSRFPSIITINPYMKFVEPKGDLSNVAACRIKVFKSGISAYRQEIAKCIRFCADNDINILITYMRYKSIKSATKFSGNRFRENYIHTGGYFRPTATTKKWLKEYVLTGLEICSGEIDKSHLLHECDGNGKGCPDCMNCSKLTYGMPHAEIKALNLSVSGIKDRNGRQGLCKFNCPDCFAKIVCFGKRPQCDILIKNKKMTGELKH